MSDTQPVEMDADERDSFLGTGGTGVLSLSSAADDPPHSIPVSYGYDAGETTLYFRLAADSDSEKGELSGRNVTFVVYGEADGGWRSVVFTGQLAETTEESVAVDSLQGLQEVHIPLVDVFGRPPRDVPFEFYRLVPAEISSRKESRTEL